ncbi:hypothetical protein FB451DRAFT_1398546 [Mycena latifolia]|nr:hypothetical protein FB451DRAFT_1398546 [Mycena latifolia]
MLRALATPGIYAVSKKEDVLPISAITRGENRDGINFSDVDSQLPTSTPRAGGASPVSWGHPGHLLALTIDLWLLERGLECRDYGVTCKYASPSRRAQHIASRARLSSGSLVAALADIYTSHRLRRPYVLGGGVLSAAGVPLRGVCVHLSLLYLLYTITDHQRPPFAAHDFTAMLTRAREDPIALFPAPSSRSRRSPLRFRSLAVTTSFPHLLYIPLACSRLHPLHHFI